MHFTITQAQALGDDLGHVTLQDLIVSSAEVDAAVAWFQALCGLTADSAPELLQAARDDVTGDGMLLTMLHDKPARFAEWFAGDDHGIYCLTEVTGSEAWAAGVQLRLTQQGNARPS